MKTKHKIIPTTMRVILITAAACGLASAQAPNNNKAKIYYSPLINGGQFNWCY